MDIIQLSSEVITAVLKHGWSLTTIAVVVTALFRFGPFRLLVTRYLPKKFRRIDNRMDRIESKIDALLIKEGVTWDAPYSYGKTAHNVTVGQRNSLSKLSAASVRAHFIGVYTRMIKDSYHSKTKGENTQMKSKWLSRKFILAVAGCAVIILNDILELNVDKDAVFTFAGILATWIATEGVVDANRKTPEVSDAYTTSKDAGNVQDTAN